jgi:hypothetical protein
MLERVSHGLSGLVLGVAAALVLSLACGPSPAASSAAGPSGTLVVVIRQGPDRVPFKPKLARIQLANQQLANILGHSIQIELDGSLLPQTQDGADDVIARLVEDVARDLDDLSKEANTQALAFAREKFERLVVRYAPAEAAGREDRWRRSSMAKLDPASKTIDVVRPEARWLALERGEIATVLFRAYSEGQADRYAHVLPDALPSREYRAWFDWHAHGVHSDKKAANESSAVVGSVDGRRVRGMIMLYGLAKNDASLVKDVRAWLVDAMSAFSSTYHHHATEVEAAPASSGFRQAESAYVGWIRAELPRMTLDERAKVASNLWVTDFRKDSGERDRWASYSFPGLDPMGFSFDTVDAWIAAGHPPLGRTGGDRPSQRDLPAVFDTVVGPAYVEPTNDGQLRFQNVGRGDDVFYRWALADRSREDVFVKGLLARPDEPFALAAFLGARHALREEADYLRFLRRFEKTPALWKVGADVHREVVYRPSALLLDESRRLWRELPFARGHVLLWFARHADGSYHPDTDWSDMLQGVKADEAALGAYLDLGWPAFESLPAAWPGLAKGSRVRVVIAHAKPLLGANIRVHPGGHGVSGTLASVAGLLCKEHAMGELAELASFARTELAARPGAGLSDVVEAADPSKCVPKAKAPARAASRKSSRKPNPEDGPDFDYNKP